MATKAAPLKPPPGHHSSIGKSKTARPTNKSSPSPKKPASPKSPKARPTPPKKVLGGHADPSAAGASATSVSSALSESEREAARARLLAPTSASFFNWRPKMDPTQAEEAAQAEAGGEKPEFKVQTGKRRTRAAKTSRPERTVSCARTAPLSLACKRLSTLRSTPCAASAVLRSDAPSLFVVRLSGMLPEPREADHAPGHENDLRDPGQAVVGRAHDLSHGTRTSQPRSAQ